MEQEYILRLYDTDLLTFSLSEHGIEGLKAEILKTFGLSVNDTKGIIDMCKGWRLIEEDDLHKGSTSGAANTGNEPYSEFYASQIAQALDHEVRVLHFYDGDTLCSTIYADFTGQTVVVEDQAVSPIKTAFGNNPFPDWKDFQHFLEERCIPRQRAGLREYLEALGLDEYDPLAILEKTGGRMAEDQQWLTIEVLK